MKFSYLPVPSFIIWPDKKPELPVFHDENDDIKWLREHSTSAYEVYKHFTFKKFSDVEKFYEGLENDSK